MTNSFCTEFDDDLATALGISEAEPGFACVRIFPDLRLGQAASGVLQLPIGPVSASWQKVDNRFSLDVEVPVGIHLQVVLPAQPSDFLFIDGEPIADDTQTIRTPERVELAVLPGSRYHFEVRH